MNQLTPITYLDKLRLNTWIYWKDLKKYHSKYFIDSVFRLIDSDHLRPKYTVLFGDCDKSFMKIKA